MPKRVSVRKRKDRRNGKKALITAITLLINPCGLSAFSNINRKSQGLDSTQQQAFFYNVKTLEE